MLIFTLIRTVQYLAHILILLLCVRAILSWVGQNPYTKIGQVYQVLVRFTEPIVMPARMLLDKLGIQTGMLDFSVLVSFFMIKLAEGILVRLLLLLA